jgi:hypothetical protein
LFPEYRINYIYLKPSLLIGSFGISGTFDRTEALPGRDRRGRAFNSAAQLGNAHLLLLDLLSTLALLNDLLQQLLLVDVVDVQASHVVLLLVSLPEHVELLLGLIVLPDDGSELIDLLVSLFDALVIVPKLVLEAA